MFMLHWVGFFAFWLGAKEMTEFVKHNYSIENAWYHNYESLNKNFSMKPVEYKSTQRERRKKSVEIARELVSKHELK